MITKIGAEILEKYAAAAWKRMLPALSDAALDYIKAYFPQHNARRIAAGINKGTKNILSRYGGVEKEVDSTRRSLLNKSELTDRDIDILDRIKDIESGKFVYRGSTGKPEISFRTARDTKNGRLGYLDDAIGRRHEAYEFVAAKKQGNKPSMVNLYSSEGAPKLSPDLSNRNIGLVGEHMSNSVLAGETRLHNQTLHADELARNFQSRPSLANYRYRSGENKMLSDAAGVDDVFRTPLGKRRYGQIGKKLDSRPDSEYSFYSPGNVDHGMRVKLYGVGGEFENALRLARLTSTNK